MESPSSQAKGEVHARCLEKWIKATPIVRVPRNQFKRVNRRAICIELGISPSTIGTNAAIRDLFDKLDSSLADSVEPQAISKNRSLSTFDVQVLEERCERAEAECQRLRRALSEYSFLELSGWRLP